MKGIKYKQKGFLELYWPRTLLTKNLTHQEPYSPRTLLTKNLTDQEPYWPRTFPSNFIHLIFFLLVCTVPYISSISFWKICFLQVPLWCLKPKFPYFALHSRSKFRKKEFRQIFLLLDQRLNFLQLYFFPLLMKPYQISGC